MPEEAADPASNLPSAMEDEGRSHGAPDFGTLLRRHRLAAGLSQEALAERARISLNGISALERGYRRTPQRETLVLLVGALALNDDQRRAFEAAAVPPSSPRHRGERSVTVGPWPSAGSTSLPLALTRFVGRDVELDEIAVLVRDHRLVTVAGAGGVGKTQTALQVAAALGDGADGPVCFVALAPIRDPSLVAIAIASALGVQEVPNRPPLDTLIVHLKNKALLLIVDNCEHVIQEVTTVAQGLLAACPRVRILATSREPLLAAGERTYRLPSLRFPTIEAAGHLRASDALEYAAMTLFADRAQGVDAHFTLTDENAPIVGEICRHLEGIPLAIELAAARVNVLPLKQLAAQLDDCLRVLTRGERGAPPRQQTMRAAIDWSYNLLGAEEQRVFECLSVLAGGGSLEAATSICTSSDVAKDDVLDLISSLIDKSLVAADLRAAASRYRLLEPFREYAREKLGMRGEEQIVAHRHALTYLELAERLEDAFDTTPDPMWIPLARAELENWRAVLDWALSARNQVELGQRLAASCGPSGPSSPAPRAGVGPSSRWISSTMPLRTISSLCSPSSTRVRPFASANSMRDSRHRSARWNYAAASTTGWAFCARSFT